MANPGNQDSLALAVERVRTEAESRRGVSSEIAAVAAEATLRALRGSTIDPRIAQRARAYFWGVVRRRAAGGGGNAGLSARFVLSTVVADLAGTGRSGAAVWEELQRGWADKVPRDVLEEYRVRLCA